MYITLHRKLKIEQLKTGVNPGAPEGLQFLFHMWNLSCYSCYQPGDAMNEERIGLWLQQTEHIRPLCDTYFS